MDDQPVASFPEFYRKLKGTLPSGRLWDVYRTNLAVDAAMLRTVVLPPGVPQPGRRVAQARSRGSTATRNSPRRRSKAIQFVPHYVTGGDLNAQVRRTLVVDPAIRTFVADYIKNPPPDGHFGAISDRARAIASADDA